jgi:TerC family integral membrane protein
MSSLTTIAGPGLWLGFTLLVLAMLALDLGVFHRKAHEVGFREALAWSAVWVALSAAFCAVVWTVYGGERGLEFATGYVIEKALSVDNIFVFAVLFSFFRVPGHLQHRVLFWGVLGALVMRGLFVAAGTALLASFHAVIYVFGAILVATGVRLLVRRDAEMHPERNLAVRAFGRLVPSVPDYHGDRFLVVRDGRRMATPLLTVLVAVEATDLVFAVDSIPAVFAVTDDPFIVYTSNIFAILGLRAMYFVLARLIERLHLLKVGLALVLVFVGVKMVIAEAYPIPIGVSLAVVAGLLALSAAASLVAPRQER